MTSVERQLELAKRIIDRLPLCPDHRDKVRGRCLECVNAALLEALEGALQVAMVAEAGNARSLDWTGIVRDIRAAIAQARGGK